MDNVERLIPVLLTLENLFNSGVENLGEPERTGADTAVLAVLLAIANIHKLLHGIEQCFTMPQALYLGFQRGDFRFRILAGRAVQKLSVTVSTVNLLAVKLGQTSESAFLLAQ
ncbi:MAG: hypothetical protein OEU50_06110 [Gammaproteobacteria bacterium]|nr:hypothetical protein [Gammaproteobacteria bacterium]